MVGLGAPLLAQGTVTGTVVDAVSARPLIGAIVTLRVQGGPRVVRTDETGSFTFIRVPPGTHELGAQRLGYDPVRRSVDVGSDPVEITMTMARIAQLDTVRVRAAKQAIYGVVGTAAKLDPIPHATIQIIGTGIGRLKVDSTGHFFAEIRVPGVYMVRAKAEGFAATTVSVTVPPNDGVEVAMLLDPSSGQSNVLEHAFADFQDRMIRLRPNRSTLVPRKELLRYGDAPMLNAIMTSPSFVKKTLRFGTYACVFVDGRPKPGVSIQNFDAADVEMVEVYGEGGDASGTLTRAWPPNAPCGDTGLGPMSKGPDLVRYVSIWLKH